MRAAVAIGVGSGLVMIATAVHAAPFSYGAPAACPDRARLEEAVSERTAVAIPEDATVRIEETAAGFVGTLELENATRQLTMERCDELVDALALSLALQLERSNEVPQPVPSSAPTPEPMDEMVPTAPVGPSPPPPHPKGDSAFARIEGGFAVLGWWGRGRVVRPEPSVFLAVERIDGWWSMRAQVGAFRSTSGELVEGVDGSARFTLAGGRLAACPLGYDGGAWSVHPCATFDVGRVTAEGKLDRSGRDLGTWAAGGANLWGTIRVLPPLAVSLTAGLSVPFTGYRLRFSEPSRVVYELSGVGGQVGAGLVVAWP